MKPKTIHLIKTQGLPKDAEEEHACEKWHRYEVSPIWQDGRIYPRVNAELWIERGPDEQAYT